MGPRNRPLSGTPTRVPVQVLSSLKPSEPRFRVKTVEKAPRSLNGRGPKSDILPLIVWKEYPDDTPNLLYSIVANRIPDHVLIRGNYNRQ